MKNQRDVCVSMVLILCVVTACAEMGGSARSARQWQEGDIIYYDDGNAYQDSVSVALPHYHIAGNGQYAPTNEPSGTHYHLSLNPKGPAGQYIRCFAKHRADGTWEHQPQWYENDPKRKLRDGYRY